MSPIRAWSLLVLFLGCITLGAQILPSAADSPFLSSGAAMDRIVLEGAELYQPGEPDSLRTHEGRIDLD
jgi:hypothetical protein